MERYALASYDGWTPALMEELQAVRSGMRTVYDCVWRKERLLRYVYWLEHREHPTSNLVGSWTDDDIRKETQLWRDVRDRSEDPVEAEQIISDLLEKAYGHSYQDAVRIGEAPELAALGLPVWNQETVSLVPSNLGSCLLFKTTDYEASDTGLGRSYSYRSSDHEDITVYIYRKGYENLRAGIQDPRVASEFRIAASDIQKMEQLGLWKIQQAIGPFVETCSSPHDVPVQFLSLGVRLSVKDGAEHSSSLSLTGFRGCFLKIRYTTSVDFVDCPAGQASVAQINTDLADFVAHFGP